MPTRRGGIELLCPIAVNQSGTRRVPQVRALPDPRLSFGFFINEVETRVGPQRAKIGLQQTFPWIGKLQDRHDAASREKLRLFGVTKDQIDQAEAGTIESDQLTIYAPIGGVFTNLSTREGEYLETGQAIVTVSDLSRLWLGIEAYESQLPMLRWGLPVRFTVETHPGEVFTARCTRWSSRMSRATAMSAGWTWSLPSRSGLLAIHHKS